MDESRPGAGEETSSQALKLSQVADLLGCSSRQVQYLRERGIVTPSQGAGGRGRAGLYSKSDIEKLRLVLGLKGLEEQVVRDIVNGVDWSLDEYVHPLSDSTQVVLDLTKHRK